MKKEKEKEENEEKEEEERRGRKNERKAIKIDEKSRVYFNSRVCFR